MGKSKEVETFATNQGSGDYLRWTDEMDPMLLQLLKEQKLKGQKDDRNFSKAAYNEVADELQQKFGPSISSSISSSKVINRLKTLKEQMYLALDALNKSGIGWNDVSKKIKAEPEVWNELIKVNEKMKALKGKELLHLDIFREIFEKDRATGNKAFNAKDKVKSWEKEKTVIDEVTLESYFGSDSESMSAAPTSSSKGNKRKAPSSAIHEDIQEVSSSMKEIARAILSTNRRVWSEEEMFEALKKMGVEGSMLLDAVDWFVEHPNYVGTFFACSENLRMEWLQRKVGF